ncbi:solute carrier family 2, facilitated glucose transporter member 10-like [Salmo trutta]|uniref:solute carrier family 2, facilitated glucose transporter member 10-like n=1 Tax=Salmo trutta TaxID=8032 RepID=UPI001131F09A|nr:solute carrier family 2, facilitated glucose transporter member 10-like [Salmo trutta]
MIAHTAYCEFQLTCVQQEVVSTLLIGVLLASLVGGWLIDLYGRRNSILLSNVLILAGSLVLVSTSYLALVVGRITVGFAICISSMSCCIFVTEMVTDKHRFLFLGPNEVGITVGILGAYAMNYILSDARHGRKYMFGSAIVLTLAQFVSIWFLPSNAGAPAECQRAGAQRGLIRFIEDHEVENSATISNRLDNAQHSIVHLFQRMDNVRFRTMIGLGLVIFHQFSGQPKVLFYTSTIFHSVGFESNASAVQASVGMGVVKVIATLVSMVFANRVSRRPLLIGGCTVMSVCLITIGLLSRRSVVNTKTPCSAGDNSFIFTDENDKAQ